MSKINANNGEKETIVLKSEPIGDTQQTALAAPDAPAPKNEPVGDVLSIRGRLHLLGWTSFNAWGKAHGYDRRSVSAAVRLWGLRTDRAPHGGITRGVMRDLRATLAQGIGPASPTPAAAATLTTDLFSTQQ